MTIDNDLHWYSRAFLPQLLTHALELGFKLLGANLSLHCVLLCVFAHLRDARLSSLRGGCSLLLQKYHLALQCLPRNLQRSTLLLDTSELRLE